VGLVHADGAHAYDASGDHDVPDDHHAGFAHVVDYYETHDYDAGNEDAHAYAVDCDYLVACVDDVVRYAQHATVRHVDEIHVAHDLHFDDCSVAHYAGATPAPHAFHPLFAELRVAESVASAVPAYKTTYKIFSSVIFYDKFTRDVKHSNAIYLISLT